MATDRGGSDDETEELATTIGLYALGEINLGNAAEQLDVSRWK